MPYVVTDIFASPAAAPSSPWTTLDLSLGTEGNAGMKGAGTSLGASSTLQVAAAHGSVDSGLDAYWNLQSIGAIPSGKTTLMVRAVVGTAPTEDPGAGNAYLDVFVAPAAALASNTGFLGGWSRTYANNDNVSDTRRPGAGQGGCINLSGVPYSGIMTVGFAGTTARVATWQAVDATTGGWGNGQANASVGTYTDVFLGIALSQSHATPASVVTWDNVVIEYQWV